MRPLVPAHTLIFQGIPTKPAFINKLMVLVNHVLSDFPAAILTIRTHDPPAHAGIQLEVKVAEILHSSTWPQSLHNTDKSERREEKINSLLYMMSEREGSR